MNITKVEDFITYTMTKEMMKQVAGDGMEFELMYQAVLENMQNNSNEAEGDDTQVDLNQYASRSTRKLDDMPIVIKGENNGQVYGREPINFELPKKNNTVSSTDTSSSNSNYKDILSNLESIKNKYEPAKGEELEQIYNAVDKYSSKYGVDQNLVLAIIKQESNFDSSVVSHAGAMGLMQLMDFNCEAYGVTDPFDIEQNIEGGVRHIKEYLDMFGGNVEMALMAYNGGPGTMSRRGVTSSSDLYKMPEETQNYVPKVMNYYKNGFSL